MESIREQDADWKGRERKGMEEERSGRNGPETRSGKPISGQDVIVRAPPAPPVAVPDEGIRQRHA